MPKESSQTAEKFLERLSPRGASAKAGKAKEGQNRQILPRIYNCQAPQTASGAIFPGDESPLLMIGADCSRFTSKPAHISPYLPISKAQRLNALDLVMHGLMTNVLENPTTGESYQNYLGITRTILATLREIRREMNSET